MSRPTDPELTTSLRKLLRKDPMIIAKSRTSERSASSGTFGGIKKPTPEPKGVFMKRSSHAQSSQRVCDGRNQKAK